MNKMRFTLLFMVFALAYFNYDVRAQQSSNFTPQAKTVAYVDEVYGTFTQYKTPSHMQEYEATLQRITIEHLAYSGTETYTLLSTVPLKNKYNNALQYDNGSNFNASTFNPLKYLLNFYPNQIQIYRIDQTDYIVKIQPQQ
jgi:hypothetical protein